MRTLLTFTKTDKMRFLSHLDVVRLFRRAFRRANIDICYTEGYNPQQKIAVTNPLPLGYESTMEFMMIETETPFTEEKREALNRQLPQGFSVPAARVPGEGFDLHTHFVTSTYAWTKITEEEAEDLLQKIESLLAKDSLILHQERMKKGKLRRREKEIRPLIHEAKITDGVLETTLSSFDAQTLRPGDLLAYLRQEEFATPAYVVFRRVLQSGATDAESCNREASVVS